MKLFITLENEGLDNVRESSFEDNLLVQADEVNAIGETRQLQDEAASVGETLQQIEEAATPEEALEIAKEHLLTSIGYSKSYSLESFQTDLESQLSIAQEGFFGRIGNAFKRAFTSDIKLVEKLENGLRNLKEKGSKENLIVDPAWSKYLIAKSSKDINARDVVTFFNSIDFSKSEEEIVQVLNKIADVYNDMATQISKNTFTTSDSSIEELNRIVKEASPILNRVNAIVNKLNKTSINVDVYPNYHPCEYKDVVNLSNRIIKLYAQNYKMSEKYIASVNTINNAMISKSMTSLKTFFLKLPAADVNIASGVIDQVNNLIFTLLKVRTYNTRAAYALVRYIEDSAKKY